VSAAVLGAVTDATRQAQEILRDGSTFQWATVTLLALVIYVYSVEVERRRWDIVLAGLAFSMMDLFNEIANSVVLHVSGRSALWTVTGDTSFLIFIGFTVEIAFLFLITGVCFVKQLPEDRRLKLLGLPNRLVLVFAFSLLCVLIEVLLTRTGSFHWEYWWWNFPFIPLIVVFGYMTFFGIAAYVYDMGRDHRRQVRVVGSMAAVDVVCLVVFGLLGWL
jgi:hypothetical protein